MMETHLTRDKARYNYISLLVLLLHRFVSPSTGTHDGKLSVGLPQHPTKAIDYIKNNNLTYAFRVRKPWTSLSHHSNDNGISVARLKQLVPFSFSKTLRE